MGRFVDGVYYEEGFAEFSQDTGREVTQGNFQSTVIAPTFSEYQSVGHYTAYDRAQDQMAREKAERDAEAARLDRVESQLQMQVEPLVDDYGNTGGAGSAYGPATAPMPMFGFGGTYEDHGFGVTSMPGMYQDNQGSRDQRYRGDDEAPERFSMFGWTPPDLSIGDVTKGFDRSWEGAPDLSIGDVTKPFDAIGKGISGVMDFGTIMMMAILMGDR